jgi:hypothetical protein
LTPLQRDVYILCSVSDFMNKKRMNDQRKKGKRLNIYFSQELYDRLKIRADGNYSGVGPEVCRMAAVGLGVSDDLIKSLGSK